MKVVYLGRLSSFHAQNTLLVFAEAGYELLVLHTGEHLPPDYAIDEAIKFPIINTATDPAGQVLHGWQAQLTLLSDLVGYGWFRRKIAGQALEAIKAFEPDLLYACWGSSVLAEIEAISHHFPGLPIVHSVQEFPDTVTHSTWCENLPQHAKDRSRFALQRIKQQLLLWAELRRYGRVIKCLAGRIDCSKVMNNYIEKRYRKNGCPSLRWMERYSRRYFWRTRLPLLSEQDSQPHLVFLGRTDFSNDPKDDIRASLAQCAQAAIHVHLADSDECFPVSSYIHRFPKSNSYQLTDGSLATFCTQFDACVVWYNADRYSIRFHNTLPSRFLFAFTAGIPIALPAGYFTACEEVVQELQIGFTYTNIDELKTKLTDRSFMAALRAQATNVASEESFEARFDILDIFLRNFVSQK